MKLDLDQLRRLGFKWQHDYRERGELAKQLDKGEHVYSIQFEPSTGKVSVHLQWPYFMSLVANEAVHPATIRKVEADQSWLHCSCTVPGVEIRTCLAKHEVVAMLKELVAEHPEGDYEVCEDDDVMALFTTWQNMTGWDLCWPNDAIQEELTDGSN